MAFRGYFALNGFELVNSSRTATHLGAVTPTDDSVMGGVVSSCSLTPNPIDSGLALLPDTCVELAEFPGLATPPAGSYRVDPGLIEIGDCWLPIPACGCGNVPQIAFDDTWPGLQAFLGDSVYRPELAPWYTVDIPQSGEFVGFWVMKLEGFGPPTVQRQLTELVGSGAVAGPARDTSQQLNFSALVIACTGPGLEYGLQWLSCALRSTNTENGTLQFFAANPEHSAADPAALMREMYDVVLTAGPTISQRFNASGTRNEQATVYMVQFTLTALNPYAWFPPVDQTITWDTVATQSMSLVPTIPSLANPNGGCALDLNCQTAAELPSATCPPEQITFTTNWPPPVCGGLPVSGIDRYIYTIPTDIPSVYCPGSAVTITIVNNSADPLTLLSYWKLLNDSESCSNLDQFPVQVTGLPAFSTLILDGVTKKYYAIVSGNEVHPVGIVATPSGAPWLPPFIDRTSDWQFEILTAPDGDFTVDLVFFDQDA